MRILFIGQRGVPARETLKDARERRVEAMARELVRDGNEVAVTCASPYAARHLTSYNGLKLVSLFSLHPDKEGGWVHALLEVLYVWIYKPQAVHASGWKAACLVRLIAFVNPGATLVWTIDSIPRYSSWLVRLAAGDLQRVFDFITVPTRELQYRLVVDYRVRAEYIPDGYDEDGIPETALRYYGLRKRQYNVTTATAVQELRVIANGYRKCGTRKKLVVFSDKAGSRRRLARDFPFFYFVGEQTRRPLKSILRNGEVIIVGENTELPVSYEVMAAGRPVVAMSSALLQETFGVSAQFVKLRDVKGVTLSLKAIISNSRAQKRWGRKVQVRARRHFEWKRIMPEYMALYHYPNVKLVPVDSARKPWFVGQEG